MIPDPHGTSPEKVERMARGEIPPVLLTEPDAAWRIGTDPSCRAMPSYVYSDGPEPRAFLGSFPSHRTSLRMVSKTGILPGEWPA